MQARPSTMYGTGRGWTRTARDCRIALVQSGTIPAPSKQPKASQMDTREQTEDRPPPLDKATLKSALKAFRKRLKVTRLDDESGLGGGAMTGGAQSSIAGIRPPNKFPPEVWQELARLGRLEDLGSGLYGLAD